MAGEALVAPRAAARSGPIAAPALARLAAFAALALFGALHWAANVEPAATGALIGAVGAATGAGAVLIAVRGGSRAERLATIAALALVLLVAAFIVAGAPLRLLGPRAWDELLAGLGDGIRALPAAVVPYDGSDAWTRTAMLLGAPLLLATAALLAFWPRRASLGRPLAAAAVLTALYAIPVVQRNPGQPLLDGAAFCVLLAAFLGIERLRTEQLAPAFALVVVATGVGALVAPRLDAAQPWVDYERIAEGLQVEVGKTFSWDHRYGPLDWPREGREVLRVRASRAAYWKAENLDGFDGRRWYASGELSPQTPELPPRVRRAWQQRIRVTNRGLGGVQLIGAGTTLAISEERASRPSGPGAFVVDGDAPEVGDAYHADVYVPAPNPAQLGRATVAPAGVPPAYLELDLPAGQDQAATVPGTLDRIDPGTVLTMRFSPFGTSEATSVSWRGQTVDDPSLQTLMSSAYGRAYELAQRLRAGASTPYDYVRAVIDEVRSDATYSEEVPITRDPLVTFLFDDRRGYCQQFSGAMALLLRMGGVPARVATGFTTGELDRGRGEYSVRDTDAHSWVEAYFAEYGWVAFDPTPGTAPARAQLPDPEPAQSATTQSGPTETQPATPERRVPQAGTGDGEILTPTTSEESSPWGVLVPALVAAVLLSGAIGLAAWRGRLPHPPLAPELAELQRALHRSGNTPSAGTTLTRLGELLGGRGAGSAYVRALRAQRYGGGPGPTRADRRALRRELARGEGALGRLRAWWALPPAGPWRRRRRRHVAGSGA